MSPLQALLDDIPLVHPLPLDLRSNQRQRDIVGRAIALMGDSGTLAALEYLKSHAVAPAVIRRVLLEPGRRAMT